ncbi:MAG: HRDC domain-containing protein [Planctomycetes bacterium]|nr:HRDC domain-containing protein [Planctomycetota bacterium]
MIARTGGMEAIHGACVLTRRPPIPEPILVENQNQVEQFCKVCLKEKRFAFDTEFVMEDRYESQVCLIQLATSESVMLIDPFLGLDLRPIAELIAGKRTETVVHAGQEDLVFSVQQVGKPPRNVFDTQLAAGFVGYDYPLSLQRLVQSTQHVRLHKAKTLTDWRRRPLSPAQIRYGAEDVSYLLQVSDVLKSRSAELGRSEWVSAELKRFEDISLYQRAEEDKIARLKGVGALNGQQLAVVRELLGWREEFAKRVNRPVRAALKDHLLVEIAKHSMVEFAEVSSLRGLNLGHRDIHTLCRVVEQALALSSDKWPVPKPHELGKPHEAPLVALATAVIRGYCMENDLAYGLVATQRSITELVRHLSERKKKGRDQGVEILQGWRGEAVGALLQDVLSGTRAVCVDQSGGEPIIRALPARSE